MGGASENLWLAQLVKALAPTPEGCSDVCSLSLMCAGVPGLIPGAKLRPKVV